MKGIIGWFFRMASELSPDGIRAMGETSWGFSSLLSGCFISFHLEDGGGISGMSGHPHPQEGGEVRHLSAVEADRLGIEKKWELFGPYLRLYGSGAVAFGTLQPGMGYLHFPEVGYLAYRKRGGVSFVLGDPVCKPADAPGLVLQAEKILGRCAFFQLSRAVAYPLAPLGYYVNSYGVEMRIDLPEWSLEGQARKNLRAACRQCEGYEIVEIPPGSSEYMETRSISQEWLDTRTVSGREVSFLNRPASMDTGVLVRTFAARDGQGRVQGFVHYDPLYENGRIIGWVWQAARCRSGAPGRLAMAINCRAAEVFRLEGLRVLSMGLCPQHRLDDSLDINSAFTSTLFAYGFQQCNWIYALKGLARHKEEYGGKAVLRYFASRREWPIRELYFIFPACGISIPRQAVLALRRLWRGWFQRGKITPGAN
jgi:hypothetical protein